MLKKLLLGIVSLAALILLTFGVAFVGPSSLPAGKQAYVGTWLGPGVVLTIRPDARVFYERQLSPPTTSDHGGIKTTTSSSRTIQNLPITRMDADRFVVGRFLISTTFAVSRPPSQVDGTWKMTVDGQELTRNARLDDASPTHIHVGCEGHQEGIQCTVDQLGKLQPLKACFDVTLGCEGTDGTTAHLCMHSKPGAAGPETFPYSSWKDDHCSKRTGMQIHNVSADAE